MGAMPEPVASTLRLLVGTSCIVSERLPLIVTLLLYVMNITLWPFTWVVLEVKFSTLTQVPQFTHMRLLLGRKPVSHCDLHNIPWR